MNIGRWKKCAAKINSLGIFWKGREMPHGNVSLMEVCLKTVSFPGVAVFSLVPVRIRTCSSARGAAFFLLPILNNLNTTEMFYRHVKKTITRNMIIHSCCYCI